MASRHSDQNPVFLHSDMIQSRLDLMDSDHDSEDVEKAIAELKDRITTTRSGHMNVSLHGKLLHSKYDPVVEARRKFEEVTPLDESRLLFFPGAGLGYVVEIFLEETENPCVWIEPELSILIGAVQRFDFTEYIRSGRLKVYGKHPNEDDFRTMFRGKNNLDVVFILHRGTMIADPQYSELAKNTENFLNKKNVNLRTMVRFDRLWVTNLLKNLVHLTAARPVSLLFDTVQNGNAVIVGAGPSLSQSLDDLKRIQNRALLIAVDTAVHVLVSNQIDPDIIVSVDPQGLNCHYLEGYNGNALLVVDPTTTYLTLRNFPPDRVFYFWSPFSLAKYLFDHLSVEVGKISFGGSVSTNAYDLALKMGCRNIYFVGQDLSFSGGLAHARGAILEERLNYKEKRLFRREFHNYNQVYALPRKKLKGIHGDPVITNDKLIIFHQWFLRTTGADMQRGIAIHNCTADGAYIEGLPHQKLDISDGGRPDLISILKETEVKFDLESFHMDLRNLHERIFSFIDLLEESILVASEMKNLNRPFCDFSSSQVDSEYDRLNGILTEKDLHIREQKEIANLIGSAVQKDILSITENFETTDAFPHTAKKWKVLDQSLDLYRGLLGSAELHLRLIEKYFNTIYY